MKVRIQSRHHVNSPRRGRVSGRRDFIQKHRSFRALPVTRRRVLVSTLLAVALTIAGVYWAPVIVNVHQEICRFVLSLFRLPVPAWQNIGVFDGWLSASVPSLAVPQFEQIAEGARMLPVAVVVALLLVSRYFGLTRNFAGFLILLLVISTFVCAFKEDFAAGTPEFCRVWLQVEVLISLIMPWLTCLIFMILQPSIVIGAAWVLLIQVYGLAFSALRLAFCVTVMHHTGMLFFPLLWFALGLLATLMYLLTFYSISIYFSAGRLWGARAEWR
jgi:hypothetical protein